MLSARRHPGRSDSAVSVPGAAESRGGDVREEEMRPDSKRRYPAFYERAVPIALAVVAVIIVLLLGIILAVLLGLFPGS